jgi:hypothetical protein
MIFPSDRLTERGDFLGLSLVPAPSAGVRICWGGRPEDGSSWEGSAEIATFQSQEESRLRTVYVPFRLGRLWEVAEVQGVALLARVTGGLVFASVNMGDESLGQRRAVNLGLITAGGQIRRDIYDISFALEFEAGLHLQGAFFKPYSASLGAPTQGQRSFNDVMPVFQLRAVMLTR